ncbi:MAG TPA: hypothetical protein ENF87_01895, partial [Thermoproteales archaeon]|nr:hypothetical protein [Thermoproteales archaeon]
EFSFEKADQAKQAVNRLKAFMEKLRLESKYHPKEKGDKELEKEVLEKLKTMINSFLEAMDNDFHTPKALAVIFEFINYFEKILYKPEIEVGRGILAKVYNELDKLLREVLGFKLTKPDYEKKFYQLVEKMLKLRDKYRAEKNWEIADSLREILTNSGLTVNDTPHGSYWSLI